MSWEAEWWGTCQNTYGEETKQILYAKKMGLAFFHDGKSPFNIDMEGKSVLDLGGGPVSLLLKCVNVRGRVIDPLSMPPWVWGRYALAGISVHNLKAEEINETGWDEVWIYNVLQHVENPRKIIDNARKAGRLIRVFEWVDFEPTATHPQLLTKEKLDIWLHGEGKCEQLNQNECFGKCYYGIFPT